MSDIRGHFWVMIIIWKTRCFRVLSVRAAISSVLPVVKTGRDSLFLVFAKGPPAGAAPAGTPRPRMLLETCSILYG
jgi:hypothetical protein